MGLCCERALSCTCFARDKDDSTVATRHRACLGTAAIADTAAAVTATAAAVATQQRQHTQQTFAFYKIHDFPMKLTFCLDLFYSNFVR